MALVLPCGKPTGQNTAAGEAGIPRGIAAAEAQTPEERQTAELVTALRATGNLHPLVAVLRRPDGGSERARDALLLLGELDVELLVQVALDTLIDGYVEDPALADQTRRETRSSDADAAPS